MFIIFQTSPSLHEYNHKRGSHGSEDFKQNSVRLVETRIEITTEEFSGTEYSLRQWKEVIIYSFLDLF